MESVSNGRPRSKSTPSPPVSPRNQEASLETPKKKKNKWKPLPLDVVQLSPQTDGTNSLSPIKEDGEFFQFHQKRNPATPSPTKPEFAPFHSEVSEQGGQGVVEAPTRRWDHYWKQLREETEKKEQEAKKQQENRKQKENSHANEVEKKPKESHSEPKPVKEKERKKQKNKAVYVEKKAIVQNATETNSTAQDEDQKYVALLKDYEQLKKEKDELALKISQLESLKENQPSNNESAAIQNEVVALKQEKVNLEEQIEENRKETERLTLEIKSLKENQPSNSNELASLQNEVTALKQEKLNLETQMEENRKETERLTEEIKSLKENQSSNSNELVSLQNEVAALKQEKLNLETQMEENRKETEKLTLEIKSLKEAAEERSKTLEKEVESLTSQLNSSTTERTRLEKLTAEQEEKIASLNAVIEQKESIQKAAAQSGAVEIDKLTVELENLKQQLKQSDESKASLQSVLDAANKDLKEKSEGMNKLQEEVQSLQSKLNSFSELNKDLEAKEEELKKLKGEVSELNAKLSGVENQLKDTTALLQKETEARQNDKIEREKEIASNSEKEAKLRSELENELERTKAALQQLEAENQKRAEQIKLDEEAKKKRKEDKEAQRKKNEEEALRLQQQQLEEKQKKKEEKMKNKEIEEKKREQEKKMLEEAKKKHEEQAAKLMNGMKLLLPQVQELKKQMVETKKTVNSNKAEISKEFKDILKQTVDAANAQSKREKEAIQKYRTELRNNKKLYNELQNLKGTIRVYCRVRPLTEEEQKRGEEICTSFNSDNDSLIYVSGSSGQKKTFEMDKVFTPQSTQEEVFADTKPLITSVMHGYNVCIFAYGQTGAGKTYTMEGSKENPGVNQRALQELFALAKEKGENFRTEISVNVLEIYNEQLHDLLNKEHKKYEIKLPTTEGGGMVVSPEPTTIKVASVEDVQKIMALAKANRQTHATDFNQYSSRSHMLLIVKLNTVNLLTEEKTFGKLTLVDLAGSERVDKTGATEERLVEAQHINKSLSALGTVIAALQAKEKHIPYRNSKLTYLLQDSLGGDSKTLMFVCCNPSLNNAQETGYSLLFASRVRNVELGPAKKHTESKDVMYYKSIIKQLEDALAAKGESIPPRPESPQSHSNNSSPSSSRKKGISSPDSK